ncbi:MAG: (d)CMP kinase [Flavobacteriales bacterium]|nr:(d)CMP kinase [Bacteroidota bacterium]MCB9241860.1 (d)CMP kinase [Flavobacteriales bacterium]
MPRKINIAIDGHSSCGKGTLAKNLAKDLGYLFIDSGAMYRAVTLYLIRNQIGLDEVHRDPSVLGNIAIHFEYDPEAGFFFTHLNGENVETLIRGMEISSRVSEVSALKEVREFLVAQQQKIGEEKGVVMDGRDIGTVVFPDAELKIFMTAEPDVRARRRYLELQEKGIPADYDDILHNIRERDVMDSTRDISPLVQAPDAIVLNNTDMTREEQAQIALTWAKGVISMG